MQMKIKRKGITYKAVEMLGKNANISDHYLTPKKVSKGEKDLRLIPKRHKNLYSAASISVKKSR